MTRKMEWNKISLFQMFLVASLLIQGLAECHYFPDEQRLYDQIMSGYLKTVRPVVNGSSPLEVIFSIRLNQIVNLNERQQVLTVNVFIDQSWMDQALSWNPADFQDVRSMRIPADQVWKPDTFIYNNADNRSTGFIHGTYIQIKHTGEISWPVPVRLRSSCAVKITYFPFDYQVCMVRFGSWIYSQHLVDYNVKQSVVNVDLSTYIKNSEWDLLSMKLEKSASNRSRGLGLHPHITALLYLKRNTFYYLFNIIVPCMMLSMLTLMTFWLSPTSGEKVTLGLSVFLAFSMFMLLIAEEVPASSDAVPLIGIYLCVVMTMTSLSVLCAVLVTNLHNRGSKLRPAPRWVASLFIRYLALPFRVSQDVQLLASTIFLSDYCKYFILHDNRVPNNGSTVYMEQQSHTDLSYDDKSTTPPLSSNHQKNVSDYQNHHLHRNSNQSNGFQTYTNFLPLQEILSEDEDETCDVNLPFLQKLPDTISSLAYHKVSFQEDEITPVECPDCQVQEETDVDIILHSEKYSSTLPQCNEISTKTQLLSEDLLHQSSLQSSIKDRGLDLIRNKMSPCKLHDTFCECETTDEDVWVMRDDFVPTPVSNSNTICHCSNDGDSDVESLQRLLPSTKLIHATDNVSSSTIPKLSNSHQRPHLNHKRCQRSWPTQENPKFVLRRAKLMIAEWCTIAKVVDRCLFVFSLIATIFAYVFLLLVMPAGQSIQLENKSFVDSVNSGTHKWN